MAASKAGREPIAEAPPDAAGADDQTGASAPVVVFTVPMQRDEPPHPGGPVTADVHPDEVENWRSAGWREQEMQP